MSIDTVSTIAAVIGALVSGIAALFALQIYDRKKDAIEVTQQTAGVRGIRQVDEEQPSRSLWHVLVQTPPTKSLRILTVSGRSVIGDRDIVLRLLDQGVDIQILLLEPSSNNWLLDENPWLLNEIKMFIRFLYDLRHNSAGRKGKLHVRFYRQPPMQMLMFIDDERLFLSSYYPVSSPDRLIYEIEPGQKSLYAIFDVAYKHLWEHAIPENKVM